MLVRVTRYGKKKKGTKKRNKPESSQLSSQNVKELHKINKKGCSADLVLPPPSRSLPSHTSDAHTPYTWYGHKMMTFDSAALWYLMGLWNPWFLSHAELSPSVSPRWVFLCSAYGRDPAIDLDNIRSRTLSVVCFLCWEISETKPASHIDETGTPQRRWQSLAIYLRAFSYASTTPNASSEIFWPIIASVSLASDSWL